MTQEEADRDARRFRNETRQWDIKTGLREWKSTKSDNKSKYDTSRKDFDKANERYQQIRALNGGYSGFNVEGKERSMVKNRDAFETANYNYDYSPELINGGSISANGGKYRDVIAEADKRSAQAAKNKAEFYDPWYSGTYAPAAAAYNSQMQQWEGGRDLAREEYDKELLDRPSGRSQPNGEPEPFSYDVEAPKFNSPQYSGPEAFYSLPNEGAMREAAVFQDEIDSEIGSFLAELNTPDKILSQGERRALTRDPVKEGVARDNIKNQYPLASDALENSRGSAQSIRPPATNQGRQKPLSNSGFFVNMQKSKPSDAARSYRNTNVI